MRKNSFSVTFIILAVVISTIGVSAQRPEAFDIVTFTAPTGWQKEVIKSAVQLGVEDKSTGGMCLVTRYKAVPGGQDSAANFGASWETIVKELVNVKGEPQMQPKGNENGWIAESGLAGYESDGIKGVAALINISGGGKMINILVLSNTDAFQADVESLLGSIVLPKIEAQTPTPIDTSENSIIGTWGKKSGAAMVYGNPASAGVAGYAKEQYTFNNNGTYQFFSKIFRYSMTNLLLVRESGTYSIAGNNLTITPRKSVIESWSKKDGTDKWGKLVSGQNRSVEKVTYQFTRHYFSGIDQWNLVLQASTPTQRDGPFSNNTTFPNAYYYAPISDSNTAIKLP